MLDVYLALKKYRILPISLVLLSIGCSTVRKKDLEPAHVYPHTWWTPVDRTDAAHWEILPQDAKSGEVIVSKRNELGLLSNFAATPFTYKGKTYASIEGFWQSLLYPEDSHDPRATYPGVRWKFKRSQVEKMTGFEAKDAGKLAKENMRTMDIDWVTFEGRKMTYRPATPGAHYKLIVDVMWEKVKQNPKVKEVLLSTGDLKLRPDHTQEEASPNAWKYCDIYMDIRSQLKAESEMQATR